MVSKRKTHRSGAVDCILCEVPVCIAAGFSPKKTKNIFLLAIYSINETEKPLSPMLGEKLEN